MDIALSTLYSPGQIVYLRVDTDQVGMVVAIIVGVDNALRYLVSWGDRTETSHYQMELTDERPL